MIHVVAACGNGMGTSMIIKLKVEKILKNMNVDATVEAMSVGQATGMVSVADIIICSTHLISQFSADRKAKITGVINLMSDSEIEEALKKVL